MSLTLRYFAVRGRAQPLRYLLVDSGVPFEDEFVTDEVAWRILKQEPTIAGPFGALPVLDWDGHVVGETLVIASYLSRRLGHYRTRSEEEIVRMEMVSSAAYLDLLMTRTALFRPDPAPQANRWPAFFDGIAQRFTRRLGAFERVLATTSGPFFGGTEARAPDYFMFEAVADIRELLGPLIAPALERCPRLLALCTAVAERPALASYLASGKRPAPFTGSPLEPEIRGRLAEYLATKRAP